MTADALAVTSPAPIPPHAYLLAAAYLEAGKGPEDVAALARLFDALPHMERDVLAAMDEITRGGAR